eukprot:TRINITY_DN7003_c0_g1_i5.p1 TRINITY_DN7003_c0_g1~~TRINITY_DN7003_c0_g1_i5.p1  ORF type:complete len:198 (+),score=17.14 TRINITY_DN7003_c0_g1_i5:201-794(+)
MRKTACLPRCSQVMRTDERAADCTSSTKGYIGSYSIEQIGDCFFIDRDGDLFALVLQFLRSGFVSAKMDLDTVVALVLEANYYGITALTNVLVKLYPFAQQRAAMFQELAQAGLLANGTSHTGSNAKGDGQAEESRRDHQSTLPAPSWHSALHFPRMQLCPEDFLHLYVRKQDSALSLAGLDLRQICFAGLDLSGVK